MSTGQCSKYQSAFDHTWDDEIEARAVRFVVLDCETTGTDPRRDRLISIGAVAVVDGEIILGDSFEALLKIEYNGASVAVHGITREEAEGGLDEPEALEAFLAYLRDGVIVGHHILHDIICISTACVRHFDFELKNRFLDTMELALHFDRDGAFGDGDTFRSFTLDALCERFGVVPHDRHTATGDAFITAQIFLKLLRMGKTAGRVSLGPLSERFVGE